MKWNNNNQNISDDVLEYMDKEYNRYFKAGKEFGSFNAVLRAVLTDKMVLEAENSLLKENIDRLSERIAVQDSEPWEEEHDR